MLQRAKQASNDRYSDPWRGRSVGRRPRTSLTRDRASYLWMLNKPIPKKVKAVIAGITGNPSRKGPVPERALKIRLILRSGQLQVI